MDRREGNSLKELKLRLKGDKELTKFANFFHDQFLLHFVRGRKYDPKKAYHTLKTYIYIRTDKYSDFFLKLLPSLVRLPILSDLFQVFKHRDPIGRIIGLVRIEFWDPDEWSLDEAMQTALLYLEEIWNDLKTEQNGIILIFDSKRFSLKQARQATPHQIKKIINLYWNAFPMKLHQVHIINSPFYFTSLFNVVKHFLPPKLRERVVMHGESSSTSSLQKYLSADILPEAVGGNLANDEAFESDFPNRVLKKEDFYRKFAAKLCFLKGI